MHRPQPFHLTNIPLIIRKTIISPPGIIKKRGGFGFFGGEEWGCGEGDRGEQGVWKTMLKTVEKVLWKLWKGNLEMMVTEGLNQRQAKLQTAWKFVFTLFSIWFSTDFNRQCHRKLLTLHVINRVLITTWIRWKSSLALLISCWLHLAWCW